MANAATALAEPRYDQVEGLLTYLVNTGVRPVSYNYEPPPGVPIRSGRYEDRRVAVADGRLDPARYSLDEHGFQFRHDHSAVRDFYDGAEIE